MKRLIATLMVLVGGIACSPATEQEQPATQMTAEADEPGPLEGAWKLVERHRSDGTTVKNPVGLMVFAQKHYSWLVTIAERPRYEQGQETDAQKITVFDSLGANAGTYEVSGSVLTRHPQVAKNPWVMELSEIVQDFKIEGDTLTLTSRPPEGGQPNIVKFLRVE